MSRWFVSGLSLGAAAVTLAGCVAQPRQGSVSGVLPSNASRPLHRSWMAGGVAKADLLYVSDGNGEVTVYRYWQHTLVGVLTDMTQPVGECADSNGNVYIADRATKKIFEFAHGGTKPIKTLNDSPDSPYICYVDPTTGNLAVANDDGSSQQGNIAIWGKTGGSPTRYTDSKLVNFQGCAYDDAGNLLVTNGAHYSTPASFAWLPKGGAKLVDINVPGPQPSWIWGDVQGIAWDGKYLAIDGGESIYRISLIHGQAYYVGRTSLNFEDAGENSAYSFYVSEPGAQATEVVGGAYGEAGSYVNYWSYTSGGNPLYELSHGVDEPVGIAISLRTN